MITIIVAGPQGVGKTKIAQMFSKALVNAGFVNFKIFTTNETLTIPKDSLNEEF